MTEIAARLQSVKQKIDAAAKAAGRAASAVKLTAVSKGKNEADVHAALAAGQRIFGENRVQEAKGKYANLRAQYPDLELHLIGPLQTNKADDAVELFDVIETLDRPKLAEALAKALAKSRRALSCYIEINIGDETQKAGIAPEACGDFLKLCREQYKLNVTGLMCIPPRDRDPVPYFKSMQALALQHGLSNLSMGMSGDFEAAINCGATEVRIGTAIFGARE
jgi:pyridoxal phosphate enzyme (YggS family)